jgi:hypothetical protein
MASHDLIDGPGQYWSDHVPPSRGQYRDLALLGLRLLGIPEPHSRLDATVAMVRLRAAIRDLERHNAGPYVMDGA